MNSVKLAQWYLSRSNKFLAATLCIFCMLLVNGCSTTGPQSSEKSVVPPGKASENNNQPTEQQEQTYKTALLALDLKDFDKAESLLTKLKTSNPSLSGPWANLGLIRLMQKKPLEAETFLLKALELNPKLAKAQNLMGLIATHNKQLDKAEQYYKQAIKNNQEYSNAHYNLALLYDIYLQDIEKAAKHYRIYSTLTNDTDSETISWLEHLESTLKQQL